MSHKLKPGDIVRLTSDNVDASLTGSIGVVVEDPTMRGGGDVIAVNWVLCGNWEVARDFRESRHPQCDAWLTYTEVELLVEAGT